MFDTGVGVVIALLINLILPRDRILRIINPFCLLYNVMVEFTNSGPKGRDFEAEEIEEEDDNFIEPIF